MKRFFLFSLAGIAGFLVDYSIFFLFEPLISAHFARVVSFITAVQVTYGINKHLTFKDRNGRYWMYLAGQSKGLLLNFLIFEALLFMLQGYPYAPHIAFISATIPALLFNFTYAKYLSFK